MANRTRIDSTAETLRIAAGAKESVEPPAHVALDETEMPFFRSVIAERPAADWQGHDLEAAAMLARAMAGVARMQAALFLEPVTVEGKINPLKQLLAEHRTMVMQLRRSLGLHALGANSDGRDAQRKWAKGREIERDLDQGDDGLIAH